MYFDVFKWVKKTPP